MTLSWILLLVFVFQWIASRYNTEKDILQKELNRQFSDARMQVMDSTLIINLIDPLIADPQQMNVFRVHRGTGNQNTSKSVVCDTVIGACVDPGKQPLVYRINITDSVQGNQFFTGQKGRFFSDSGNIALRSIRLIINQAIDSGQGSSAFKQYLPAQIDTAMFKKIFHEKLVRQELHFGIAWYTGKATDSVAKLGRHIFLSSRIFNGSVGAEISNYTWYLVKRIIPQILFVIALLVITGFAFMFTYRSLKKQVLLNAMRNDFIGNITHELKTPVATVKVALESLRNFDMKKDPAVTGEYLDMASMEMDRLDQLISKVLNLSLLEEHKDVVSLRTADLKLIAEKVIRSMKQRFDAVKAVISFEAPDEQYLCTIDELFVEGVLINLVDNSLKYGGDKPWIRMHLSQDQNKVELTVSDHGPGIPEEYREKVFDKFFRVPAGDLHNVKGHGLGLSYAEQVMKQHKGAIRLDNPDEGGCAFVLTFPKG